MAISPRSASGEVFDLLGETSYPASLNVGSADASKVGWWTNDRTQLTIYDSATASETTLALPADVTGKDIFLSADGGHVAVTASPPSSFPERCRIYFASTAGGGFASVFPDEARPCDTNVSSEFARPPITIPWLVTQVAWDDGTGGWYAVDMRTGSYTQVLAGQALGASHEVYMAPVGDTGIALVERFTGDTVGKYVLLHTDGSEPTPIELPAGLEPGSISGTAKWSSDGNRIALPAWTTETGTFAGDAIVDIPSATVLSVVPTDGGPTGAFNSDGTAYAFFNQDETAPCTGAADVYVTAVDGSWIVQASPDQTPVYAGQVFLAGDGFALKGGTCDGITRLSRFEDDGTGWASIFTELNPPVISLTDGTAFGAGERVIFTGWDTDGQTLNTRASVWSVRLDGSDLRQLIPADTLLNDIPEMFGASPGGDTVTGIVRHHIEGEPPFSRSSVFVAAGGDAEPPPPSPCETKDAVLIGVRGSGDNDYGLGYAGRHARRIAQILQGKWGITLYDDDTADNSPAVTGLTYPAAGVGAAVITGGTGYAASVRAGSESLLAELMRLRSPAVCGPEVPILLVGFSQGAEVIQNLLDQLAQTDDPVSNSIAGVALLAAPNFDPTDPAARGTFVAGSFRPNGSAVPGVRGAVRIEAPFASLIRTYCLNSDPVCQWTSKNVGGIALNRTHTNAYCPPTPAQDCPATLDGGPLMDDAAALLAWETLERLGQPHPPNVLSGVMQVYRTSRFATAYRLSAATLYSLGAPSVRFAWDYDSDGVIDGPATDAPYVVHEYGSTLRPRQVISTVSITLADGSVHRRQICVRVARIGRTTC